MFSYRHPVTIHLLASQNLANIDKCNVELTCESCVLGKKARSSFPKVFENHDDRYSRLFIPICVVQ